MTKRSRRRVERALPIAIAAFAVSALLVPQAARADSQMGEMGAKPGVRRPAAGGGDGRSMGRGHGGRGHGGEKYGYPIVIDPGYFLYGDYGYSSYYRPYRGSTGWVYYRNDDGYAPGYSHLPDYDVAESAPREYRATTATDKGWELLRRGSEKRALTLFANEARVDPSNAMAKLGYALSAAEAGDLALASMAMRRAARTDARALAAAPIDPRMQDRIRQLIDVYHPPDHSGPHGPDAHFMAAALLVVVGEFESAGRAVAYAVDNGDSDDSTLALQSTVDAINAQLAWEAEQRRRFEAAAEPSP